MIALSINVNKIALLRNARKGNVPDPLDFAIQAIECGAQGITVHPRADLRHITPNDVSRIKNNIQKSEFNIEGNPQSVATKKYPGFLNLVSEVLPTQCTLVPDKMQQLTSDHGWDLEKEKNYLVEVVEHLQKLNIRVSLFVDANYPNLDVLAAIRPNRVELFTGPFANNWGGEQQQKHWQQLVNASQKITAMGIDLNAGHDLNLSNLQLIKKLPKLKEVSIGQALVTESLRDGWQNTIKKYLKVLATEK